MFVLCVLLLVLLLVMFSLDVVVWKGKRSEHEAAMKKAKQQRNAATGHTLPRVVQDKRIKQIYGKTTCACVLC